MTFPARRHKLGCLCLSVLIFARALYHEICFCAPFGALRLSARLIPNRLSYPESVTVSRNDDLIPKQIWSHRQFRSRQTSPQMRCARNVVFRTTPGNARASTKRLRYDIRMHVTMRVAHNGIWGWLLTWALAVMNCACVRRALRTHSGSDLSSLGRTDARRTLTAWHAPRRCRPR